MGFALDFNLKQINKQQNEQEQCQTREKQNKRGGKL